MNRIQRNVGTRRGLRDWRRFDFVARRAKLDIIEEVAPKENIMGDSTRPARRHDRSRRRSPWLVGIAVALFAAAFVVGGCEKAAPPKAASNPRVIVTTPITDSVIDYQDFTGRLDAFKTVEIKARVTGYITDAPFKEGDPVKQGSLLFQ